MAKASFTFDQPPGNDKCSDDAKAEVLEECENLFCQLQKFQKMIISADTETCHDEGNETPDYQNALAVELDHWKHLEPQLISSNPDILTDVGIGEITTINEQLDMVVSYYETKRDSLCESLKREKLWLVEKKQVLGAVTDQVGAVREKLTESGKLQDMKKRIKKMKAYQATLMETLSDLLEEHFPAPTPGKKNVGKKKTPTDEPEVAFLPLNEVLELLTNKTLDTPHEPYVTMDERFWQPYVEMLLRNGIATRHAEDHTKLRLESFY